ncbi:uncharacterized protein LOC115995955 [Ipomoea triloba]|uniref:uncharacterized protein LOC115995955 n=1 Tax=Ipomoea triloba TaxID=35885 RepID=UPI00125D2EA7|nr:uncharacterized protein LOC115995955 [Ipomoea triloba]
MDISAIEDRCADLTIDKEEVGGLEAPDVHGPSEQPSHWEVVGRFLTDRLIKFEHMQQVLASVWQPIMGMRVLSLEDNLFLFQFPHYKDVQRVFDDGPWSYENNLLVCKQVAIGFRPEDVVLDSVDFWIQIDGLPSVYATSDFIQQIRNYVGSFLSVDPNNFGSGRRSYYRIRVRINVLTPLKRRMKLNRRDGTSQWVTFKYERLSIFCFCCGLLGHSDKFCRMVYEKGISPDNFPYGAWLRAGSRRQVQPVGAKWLLAELPSKPNVTPSSDILVSPLELVERVESSGLQGDLKRRRDDTIESSDTHGKDIVMSDGPKNLQLAGLESQSRPSQ